MSLSAPRARRRWRLGDFTLPLFIVLFGAVATWIEPRFLSASNLSNLARQLVPLAIAAVGQSFAVISGGLDLSIAAVLSLSGIAGILVMNEHGIAAGIATMITTGALAGLTSGAVIAYLRTTPLIVTLGMMSIAQAFALILSNGVPIYKIPEAFASSVGFGDIAGVPVTVLIGMAVLLGGWVLLRKTLFGRYVYAIGSSRSAAAKSGIDVRFHTMMVYGVVGLTSGIGAIVMTSWVGAAQPVAAPSLALESIGAIVLGGVALAGGSGGIVHVLFGTIILGMMSNALNMIGISSYYQMLAVGLVIIVAVSLDSWRRRGANG